jgi:hypothetical protein
MANPFDQFDAQSGNPFDRFDSTAPKSGERNLSDLIAGRPAPVDPLSRTEKVATGMMDPIHGGAQLLTKMLPEGVTKAGDQFNNWLADKTGLVARIPEGGVDQMTREREAKYQQRRTAQGEEGLDAYRLTGNIVSPANLAIASRAPAAASLMGRMAAGAGLGAATSSLTPVTGDSTGDFVDEKMKQVAAGGITGGLFPAVAAGLGRVISPNASKNASLDLLRSEGVRPTVGQTLGGWANAAEEKLQSVPIMGDMISRARRSANSDFERAAFNRALKPIGQELPKGLTGRDAVVATETALKDKYDDVLGKIGALKPDQAFNDKVDRLQTMVSGYVMPKAEKAKFASAVNDLKAALDDNGVMTSEAFKSLESSLGTDARKLASSTNIYEGKMAGAVKQLQEELRDMLGRQAGSHASDLKAVNTGWANFKRVQNAASKLGAEEGEFTAAQFQNAVRAMDKSKDKGAFARGNALGQDLGDAGKKVLGSKVPDSGTPGRLMMSGLTAGGAGMAINPAIPAGLAAGGALYTQPAQRALVYALTQRGASADAIAEILRKNSVLLGGAAAPLGAGLLNQ